MSLAIALRFLLYNEKNHTCNSDNRALQGVQKMGGSILSKLLVRCMRQEHPEHTEKKQDAS